MPADFFLCGCKQSEKKRYAMQVVDKQPNKEAFLSSSRFDKEGYEICPEHGLRIYGWASPQVSGPQGNNVLDYSHYGPKKKLSKIESTVEDKRDNRDPEEIGRKILSRTNGG